VSSLQVSANDPDYLASAVFDRLVYGFHPYGLPGQGTAETVAGITREDLRRFHAAHFVPNNMILAVVGDTTPEEALAQVQRTFGAWPKGALAPPAAIEPPAPARRVIAI